MSDEKDRYGIRQIVRGGNLVRLAAIGTVVGSAVVAYAAAAGFFPSDRLTQTSMINRFQDVNGVHPGFRRNHAKGVCVEGHFEANDNGSLLSKAFVFHPGRVAVEGRLATAVGVPYAPDTNTRVRSMALRFVSGDGEEWRTGMNDIPVFGVRDAKGFYDQLLAFKIDPATGAPDPAKVAAFFEAHPEAAKAAAAIKAVPFSSGFDNARYNSLNAFVFRSGNGTPTTVRWSMVPEAAFEPEGPMPPDTNFLFDDFIQKVQSRPLRWKLFVALAEPGDDTRDATVAWPATRKQIELGTLTLDQVKTEEAGNCRDINFDPLVLPDGIEPSGDPLLSARSAAYSVSFRRRAGEPHTPSAVQIKDGQEGAR